MARIYVKVEQDEYQFLHSSPVTCAHSINLIHDDHLSLSWSKLQWRSVHTVMQQLTNSRLVSTITRIEFQRLQSQLMAKEFRRGRFSHARGSAEKDCASATVLTRVWNRDGF